MSAKAAEYLKRTCLICGCHTNQTINIYEPRSGPNIVHLIQAKFKFQPLNDDKYLCYSCNNWLINWHSLQALNSNDTESPSGTFRSHMNMVMQEKHEDKSEQTTQITQMKPINKCRPVARVSPRIADKQQEGNATTTTTTTTDMLATNSNNEVNSTKSAKNAYYPLGVLPRNLRAYRAVCKNCKRRIVCVTRTKNHNIVKKCRKCRKAQNINESLPKNELLVHKNDDLTSEALNKTDEHENENNENIPKPNHNQRWQPMLDGKVVSKLRRLGTSLARDVSDGKRIFLSVAKEKPQWERQLDDDEILLDFNTTISEVLPIAQRNQQQPLTVDSCADDQITTVAAHNSLGEKVFKQEFDHQLPKGLTISLVTY